MCEDLLVLFCYRKKSLVTDIFKIKTKYASNKYKFDIELTCEYLTLFFYIKCFYIRIIQLNSCAALWRMNGSLEVCMKALVANQGFIV